jgi:hypothetical protein
MSRMDLSVITQAMQKIEDEDLDYKNNKTWKRLKALRCEIEIDIARQRYEYLTQTYAGDKNEKYYKDLQNCEYVLQKNEQEINRN